MNKLIIDLHAKITKRRMEAAANAEVQAIYEEIWTLRPELQSNALHSWWSYLQSTCTTESPCIECLRGRGD
jgi:hypothetical protein